MFWRNESVSASGYAAQEESAIGEIAPFETLMTSFGGYAELPRGFPRSMIDTGFDSVVARSLPIRIRPHLPENGLSLNLARTRNA
jgi:hypothetical protein